MSPDFFEKMREEEFAGRYGDTPLERPGLAGMRRNYGRPSGRAVPSQTE